MSEDESDLVDGRRIIFGMYIDWELLFGFALFAVVVVIVVMIKLA